MPVLQRDSGRNPAIGRVGGPVILIPENSMETMDAIVRFMTLNRTFEGCMSGAVLADFQVEN